MKKDKQTIYAFDRELIRDYFASTQRQAPGSPEMTLKALGFVEGMGKHSKIADIGCGTGGQTLTLAQNTEAQVMGVDLSPCYIKKLEGNAKSQNLQDRLKGLLGDMKNLPFQEGELDLIWSEGAIYNMGFERGLKEWRKFLKPGGYIAVTENTWFTEERPTEIETFWQKAYPEIDTIPVKMEQMQQAGYLPIANFVVPESCWINYYSEMQEIQPAFLEKHKGNKSAEEFVKYQGYESDLYDKYKAYYGYVFYIGKRMD